MNTARSEIASATFSDCSTMIIVRPAFLERADDLEHLLDDDRREPERQLVDDEHLGLVDQRHRQREHLLLAARQILRRRVAAGRASIGKISSTRSMRRRCSRRA